MPPFLANWQAPKKLIAFIGCCLALAAVLGYLAAYVAWPILLGGVVSCLLIGVIMRNPVVGAYLLIFFLPFERIGSIDIANVTIRISQVIAIATVTSWIIRGFALNKFKLRSNPIIWPLFIFAIINILGIINSPNLQRSLVVLTFTLFTIAIAIMLPNVLRHPHQIQIAIIVLCASMALVTLFGLYQFFGDVLGLPTSVTGLRPQYSKDILGFPRVQATALEPLYFANYLLIPLSILLALLLNRQRVIKPLVMIGLIALGGLNVILTVSRGGYIALAVAGLVLGCIYYKEVLRPRNVLALTITAVVVLALAFKFFNVAEQLEVFTKHVTNIFGGASYVERVETWSLAYDIWLEHPWVGVGPGGFGPIASFHPLITPGTGYKIVNNEYFELLAETGLLGLLTFSVMVSQLLIRSYKAIQRGRDQFLKTCLVGLTVALVAILVQYNTFSILYIMHIWATIGLMIATQNLLLHEKTAS
ncbi:MAG: O-antigen ligase family protein [Candidatus Kerfeldbacteria bacterium]|nr:O-antigen ligase family protein [Candidatus Kerfeldbacteria bacterium]